jgi:cell wall-associated NlpC family hydrolase
MPFGRAIATACTATFLAAVAPALADPATGGVGPSSQPPSTAPPAPTAPSRPTVQGARAKLVNGVAYAPASAPAPVKRLIWAVNQILRKPYVYGGGHASFVDRGYDCSGLVSYALHYAGLVSTPMSAPSFLRWGTYGPGRWITVWARSGHVFAQVAGLRLDTTPYPSRGVEGPRWRPQMRDVGAFTARHLAGL